MPFLRDTSDVKFAFVSGGKDPDEIIKNGGVDAMQKIIDDAMPLVEFLWKITNENFVVSTPGGRVQAEKFLQAELEKIQDVDLRREMEKEYAGRKFNEWRKWKKADDIVKIKLPDVDTLTRNTLVFIVNTYPELVERYGDFLTTLNIDFGGNVVDLSMDQAQAEKYIVSLKLQRYLERLNIRKREITAQMLSGGDADELRAEMAGVDADIQKAQARLEALVNI